MVASKPSESVDAAERSRSGCGCQQALPAGDAEKAHHHAGADASTCGMAVHADNFEPITPPEPRGKTTLVESRPRILKLLSQQI